MRPKLILLSFIWLKL